MEVLHSYDVLQECGQWDYSDRGGDRGIECFSALAIVFEDSNLVELIYFEPSLTITVGDVITKYGDPDSLFVVSLLEDEYGVVSSVSMFLFYDNMQMTLHLPDAAGDTYILDLSTIVAVIQYSETSFYNLHAVYNDVWQGFGEYPISSIP